MSNAPAGASATAPQLHRIVIKAPTDATWRAIVEPGCMLTVVHDRLEE